MVGSYGTVSVSPAGPPATPPAVMVVPVRLTVLGACGAFPEPGQACSGYLVEHDGFRLLIDAGYAIVPRLLELMPASRLDAVFISHGHPDHCADLNPLLRARALSSDPPPALPVYALPKALDPVLALDEPGMLTDAAELREFSAGDRFALGPFRVGTLPLPHFVPNAGLRLTAGGQSLAYTGDSGPSPDLITLAGGADLFLAEATFADGVPPRFAGHLSTAAQAGRDAASAGAGRLVLTHLWPGSDPDAAVRAASRGYPGEITVARPGLTMAVRA
jgi:ribonuclease BN (tRNA processing enzyme)